ncbi:hypothetical protein QBC34DRAFT_436782 [Podospora aff. communis PSN243]|uniref:Uncharacterized protein n=1 Tax=Podospora aff. communis PSN243 TaxID=3040156 RepID=A0AAV9GU97_9PEZI|nr:hypothetical protein QBC34DRAFT_436782 [Podospora aff. communis PSN243]
MAMSRMMIALSCLAALTFVSNASLFSKSVIYTILCTIGRIDWSDITTAKPANSAVVEIDTGADAADAPADPLEVDTQPFENVMVDNGDGEDIIDPPITQDLDTKQRSRASSISSTTSLFDKPTHNERPSTPDTEIGDIPEFSTLASKYQDGPVVVNTEGITEPSTTASLPDVQLPPAPTAPPSNTSVTKYSMKPTELVHAVEDFSLPILTPPSSTSNKRNLDDTLQHGSEAKNASEGHMATDATKTTEQPPQSVNAVPGSKKRKLSSRQRRQRALRLAGGSAPATPSPLSQGV